MTAFDRRALLRGGLVLGGTAAAAGLARGTAFGDTAFGGALVRADRPALTHGVQSGDVTAGTGVVWARADRPARMLVARRPDFFLCSGDTVYADGPIAASVPLPDGTVWRNLVTEEKSAVAQTLDQYRGQYKYNLLDEPLRRFAANVAQVNQWDDHEVRNNWYPGEVITNDARYTETSLDVLAARARQAFSEFVPIGTIAPDGTGRIYRKFGYGPLLDLFVLDMRTNKDPNTTDLETVRDGGVLGREQTAWLKRELARSTATWKVIANDLPLGLVVPDGADIEAVAQGDPGAPRGVRHVPAGPECGAVGRVRVLRRGERGRRHPATDRDAA